MKIKTYDTPPRESALQSLFKFRGLSECPIPILLKSFRLMAVDNKKKGFTDNSDMPLRIYSMSLAPPRSSTTQHLKQELRFTQTDNQATKKSLPWCQSDNICGILV